MVNKQMAIQIGDFHVCHGACVCGGGMGIGPTLHLRMRFDGRATDLWGQSISDLRRTETGREGLVLGKERKRDQGECGGMVGREARQKSCLKSRSF